MPTDLGDRPWEIADRHQPSYAAHGAPSFLEPAFLHQVWESDQAVWDLLERLDREFHARLDQSGMPDNDRRAIQADLESIAWLSRQWSDVQHNARCLKDFRHWLKTPPSRQKLFSQFCRHAIPAEWDCFLANGQPPFIFPSEERFAQHGEHCHLCRVQRQLAEGRRGRAEPLRPTWGERWVLDFLTTFCNEALAAVCDPHSGHSYAVWSETPALRLALPDDQRVRRHDADFVEIPLRLVGSAPGERVDICLVAQHISRSERQAEAEQRVRLLPVESGLQQPLAYEGELPASVRLPLPRDPGRLLLRYAVHAMEPSNRKPPVVAVNALAVDLYDLA